MIITRRITFRLYPSKSQTAKLFEARRLHAYLYNACVEHRKTSYYRFGKSINYQCQQAAIVPFKECWPEYRDLNHGSLQATVKRVDFAFQRFFKGIGGYPKFQSIRKYSGWTYPDARQGFKVHSTCEFAGGSIPPATRAGVNGYLELRDLGFQLQMRGKALTWGTPTTCTIVYRNGKWYASITVNCEPERVTGMGAVGIDFGVLTAAALSDGIRIENPKFLARTQAKVRSCSKAKRRKRSPDFKKKIKGSKRWRKASKRVALLQHKVASQRQDWVHKTSGVGGGSLPGHTRAATQIVSSNSLVATEKLNLKGMTASSKLGKRKRQKTGLNHSILDVGIGMLRSAIEYKLAEAGGVFVEVPTVKVKPSQTCPACGHQEKKPLSQRVHDCQAVLPGEDSTGILAPKCGLVEDRDVAAAQVMLKWALGTSVLNRGEESSTVNPAPKQCGGFRQLTSTKRQKLSERAQRRRVVHFQENS